jgi:ADP-ribose pyrophosphatase YjhB (NUDIX family)
VCLDADHRVLLVRSRHQRGWGLPGGLLQRDEQPAATLVREMAEEIGVVVAAGELSTPAATIVDPDARQVTIVYLVTLPTDAVPDGVEVVQVDWFSRAAVPADVVRGTAESLRLTGFTAS